MTYPYQVYRPGRTATNYEKLGDCVQARDFEAALEQVFATRSIPEEGQRVLVRNTRFDVIAIFDIKPPKLRIERVS